MRSGSRTAVSCGVDIGSTNVKVVLMNASGQVVARQHRPTPRDVQGLSIDIATLITTIDEMVIAACGTSFGISAVSVAGIGEDGVLVDDGLQVLGDALSWFDPRRQGVFRAFRRELHDSDTFDASSDASRTMTGWRWSREQEHGAEASSWLAVADLPSARWSGRAFMSDTLASRTGAWRTRDRSWAQDRVELTLGSTQLLPTVLPAGEALGPLRSPTLEAAGVVSPDCVVIVGGHDHPLGGWGVDQLSPGSVLDSMGTAEVVVLQAASEQRQRRDGVDMAPGIRSSGRTLMRVEELTRNVAWASQDPSVAAEIHSLMSGATKPVAVLESDYFRYGGRGGGRPSYSLDAPRDPLARASAVLGALARVGGAAIDAVRAEVDTPTTVRTAGGWARSPGWLRIKEAVTGYEAPPIVEPEVTAVSAALLAAVAVGWGPDPAHAFAEGR